MERGLFGDKKSHSSMGWGKERKLSIFLGCRSLSEGYLSLEEALAFSQQSEILLQSTAYTKEDLPPYPTL